MSYEDYEEMVDALESGSESEFDRPRRIVSLPDGSVDYVYRIRGLEGDRIDSRETFGRQLLEGEGDSFSLERIDVRPGGQAVNAARQVHALGDESVLVGHLDHPVFAECPFETHSMGAPTRIRVLAFDDEEVLLVESGSIGGDVFDEGDVDGETEDGGDGETEDSSERADDRHIDDDWSLQTLESVVDPTLLTDADALCCANWVTYPGLAEVFECLGSAASTRLPVVFDPGAVGAADERALADLCEALSSAQSAVDVVLSVNRAEAEAVASVVGASGGRGDGDSSGAHASDEPASTLEAVRSTLEVAAVVLHGTDVAAVATTDGVREVPMLSVEEVTFTTGAGDRFSAGVASALARGWEWGPTLALANACSAHFVETGETADPNALAAFVRDRR